MWLRVTGGWLRFSRGSTQSTGGRRKNVNRNDNKHGSFRQCIGCWWQTRSTTTLGGARQAGLLGMGSGWLKFFSRQLHFSMQRLTCKSKYLGQPSNIPGESTAAELACQQGREQRHTASALGPNVLTWYVAHRAQYASRRKRQDCALQASHKHNKTRTTQAMILLAFRSQSFRSMQLLRQFLACALNKRFSLSFD